MSVVEIHSLKIEYPAVPFDQQSKVSFNEINTEGGIVFLMVAEWLHPSLCVI